MSDDWELQDEQPSRKITRSHEVLDSDQGRLMAGGRSVATTGAQYSTAMRVQNPRALVEVKRRLLEEARELGETAYYGWGRGKDAVMGPSISLAMAAARSWGNCAVQPEPIQELPDAYVFSYAFIDLETGFTIARQFRQSKHWTIYGKIDEARKEDMRFQIGQSKAQRNVILSVLPKSLINAAMKAAQSGVREKVQAFVDQKGIAAAQDLILRGLAKHGVTEQQILDRVGVAELKGIDVDDIVRLRGDLHAIEDGQERADNLFGKPDQTQGETSKQLNAMLDDDEAAKPVGFQGYTGPQPDEEPEPEPETPPPPKRKSPAKAKATKAKSSPKKTEPDPEPTPDTAEPEPQATGGQQGQLPIADADDSDYPDGFLTELAAAKSAGQVEVLRDRTLEALPPDAQIGTEAVQAACQQRIEEIRSQYRQM